MKAAHSILAAALLVSLARPAAATGFTDYGGDLEVEPTQWLEADGYFRLRGAGLYNLDLDHGTTPSGQTLYPVSLTDPEAQLLSSADMRLRTDLAAYWPDGGLAVKVRIDALDNVALGSAPDGIPAASATQRSPDSAVVLKRAYGEALTPLGLLAAGRMGSHWGLGMLANGGDCDDCDSGDAADRIAFITSMFGHLWAVAYDFTATGPFVPNRTETRAIDIAPSAMVHTITVAGMRYDSDLALRRRTRADKWTGNYGAYLSHRWQTDDIPATYLPTAQPVPVDAGQVMARGYQATAVDLWVRVTSKYLRVELEAAYLNASVDQSSLIPGVLFHEPVTSNQLGAAVETSIGDEEGSLTGGIDGGFASGDQAPGFGAFPKVGATSPVAGDLDGAQARPPFDTTVDNFRFHPDYRVDRILFREIIGSVTDAGYLRPHVDWAVMRNHRGTLTLGLAAIASWAVYAASTPGGERPLGVEIDPTIRYDSPFGFGMAIEQATLLPLSGLDNPQQGLDAQPAQLWRARLMYGF